MKWIKYILLVTIALTSWSLPSEVGYANKGGIYYTQVNIWYEKPTKILSTNYHKGLMIPVGTQVEILKQSKKRISFKSLKNNEEFRIILVKDYTDLNKEEFFNRYFGSQNPLESSTYASFSNLEKNNIQSGNIEMGMSKEAVLMAYGYPPSHRTPSIENDRWVFWKSRMVNDTIIFHNNILSET